MRAHVIAPYVEGGFGFPLEAVSGSITFEDDQSVPDALSLQGKYYSVGSTIGVGFGASYGWIVMGDARSNLDWGNLTYNTGVDSNGIAIGLAVSGKIGHSWAWGKPECCK